MAAHLLVLYPIPKNAAEFDRRYREEHLPYAGPRLVGATGVATRKVVGPPSRRRLTTCSRRELPVARHPENLRDVGWGQGSARARGLD
jgi:hypothetical protein